ncbi:hypothetical protein LRS10_09375 [Phenylobacterium sp. J426]|uniref:hypothetical protein n=1 Tax=Phenylobacterium sp. J426 TaxID=2898439 RepID=UPI0021508615|nr:hypothetical protein [Phenylobacterium sp. J426]MCR5874353.1 hypothetical protein [Phenylobacterium sp. J426]
MPHAPAPWLGLLMQAAFYLVTAVAVIATMRQLVKGLQDAFQELKRWAEGMDAFRRESESDRAAINQRLTTIERDEGILQRLNDALTELRTESRIRFDHIEKSGERTAREVAGIQRSLANLAAGKTTITKLED